jgi:hypothetical protein
VTTFHNSNAAAPATDFTATITWGDGGTTTLSGTAGYIVALGNGNFAVLAAHTFGKSGALTLSVLIDDVGGASVTGSCGISVTP